ncbi:hypothetical protein TNCV_1814821 [Trichonephila clavipes]|nr:hypothetical protein TNCV_1814821 [Trichonephila clavipes]
MPSFTKFTWLYPVKSATLEDCTPDKLNYNSKGLDDYCTEEKIQANCISPPACARGNGQSGENPPNSNPRFDQVVNRRSYTMVQIRRPTSKEF